MARFLAGAMEAVWLLAAFLIPLAEAHQTWLLPRFDMPKVFALRTLALLLVVLWVSAWAVRLPGASARGTGDARGWLHPARGGLVVAAAAAVALASLFSFLVSPLRSVGLWGVDPGRDSGALFSIGAYLVFFAVLARRLRTRRQFRRLLWALTAASVIAGLRGVGQHFGWDPFMVDALPMERVQMGFGNPIPAAAYLIMTIPLTVALALQYGQRLSFLTHALAGAILICAQLAALLFTLSRGPWIGLLAGLALMLAAFGRTGGWRAVARPAAMLVIALALALALGRIPVPGTGPAQDALAQRLASVAPELTGKLSQRWAIWAPAAQVFLQSPWFEPGRLDGVAELRLRWLRPVLGYGPDTYSQVYPLGGRFLPTPVASVSAHNFFVQTAIELGALGVAAYLGLFGAIAWTLALRLRPALGLHRGAGRAVPDWAGALAAAALGVLTARVLEQCAGVAAVADVHLTWMLAGMAVALAALERGEARRPPAGESRATASEVAAGATAGGRAAKTAPAPRAQPIVLRVPAALLVAGGALTLWTIAVAGEMKAALLWTQARAAIAGGSLARGLELLDRAIALSPAVADYRQERAQLLFNAGTGLQRPAGTRSAALWEAYGTLREILARNPLDARARSGTAEILSEIARLNPAVRSQALRAAEALLALQPGYWGSRVVLAGCLLALDLPERALAAVEEGRRLGGLDYADTYRLYALQADALDRLGHTAEALSAARCSVALAPLGFVSGLLQRHGEVSRKPLPLPAQDLAHCPEAQRTPNRRPATNPE